MRTSRLSGARHDYLVAKRRGHRGDGTVYFSKVDRRWVARFPIGGGKAKRVKRRTEDEADAELDKLRRLYRAGGVPATASLDAYLDEWLDSHARNIEPSTLRSYRGHVKLYISPLLGGIPLGQLAPRDVRRLIDDLERRGKSPGTIHLVVRTLSTALAAAVAERSILDNPTRGVKLPKIRRAPIRAITPAGADAILDAVSNHWTEPIVRLLLGSGLRLGEAVALNQGDVHVDERYVSLRESKTTLRAVSISDDAAAAIQLALERAPRRGPNEPLFFGERPNRDGHRDRLRGDSVSAALPRLLVAAGLPRLTPHGLRHAVATLMVAAGVPMRAVADQLGHANPGLTAKVYAHVHVDTLRDAVRSLDRGRRAR